MNRHRLYWSAMGIEPNPDLSELSKRNEAKKESLKLMIEDNNCNWDDSFLELATMLRKIKEEHDELLAKHKENPK